jgi:alpha-N-arabinofuranosidase
MMTSTSRACSCSLFPDRRVRRAARRPGLNTFVASPTYTLGRSELPYLDVSTTYNPRDSALFVNVLNRSKSLDIATRVESQEGALAKNVEVWQMNHADLKATHGFGDDKKVVPLTKQLTAQIERNGLTYTFPAHSLTILKLKLE